jgi:hypothetical protein
VLWVDLKQLHNNVLSLPLQFSLASNSEDKVNRYAFSAAFNEISSCLPVHEGECDSKRILPVLQENGFELLVIVSKLELDFWQILFEVDLDDTLQHILLVWEAELIILENLCKHLL